MGIIRIFLFLFLFVFSLSAQTVRDTVFFDGDQFVKHIVKAGESLTSISQLHKVTASDIIANNEIQKQLYYNQLLYIPIYKNQQKSKDVSLKNEKEIVLPSEKNNDISLSVQKKVQLVTKFKDTSVLNIALIMPYSHVRKEESDITLSFHIGIELALDSLRKQGSNIRLHTFDTNKDSLKVYQLVSSKALDDMDIIIGPLYADNFRILCNAYGSDTNKILISPLSKSIANVKKFIAVYQLSLPFQIQKNIIAEYILRNHKNERIIILNEKMDEEASLDIKKLFSKEEKTVEIFTVESTKADKMLEMFKEKQVVIIPSENQAFVSKLLGSIGGMDFRSLVFGLYDWKTYDNLDINNMMFLDVKFPNAYSLSSNSDHNISFLKLFEKKYSTNHTKYTYIAYNTIMHFCSDFSYFKFQDIIGGGKINTYAPLYHYVDYELIPVE